MNPKEQDITLLDLDHPGATDVRYRKRRETITKKAVQFFQHPATFPRVRYTKTEDKTWQTVLTRLDPLHKRYASCVYLEGKRKLALPADRVPQLEELSRRLYRFTMEFGLVREKGELKAYGAGLLSSFGELPHAFSSAVVRKKFSVQEIVCTPYDYSDMQQVLFVIPSFKVLRDETEKFFRTEGL